MANFFYPSLRDQYGSAPAGYSDDAWFAVASDHVVRMTIDWGDDPEVLAMNVGTCTCGKVFRVPWDGGGLPGALARLAQMDALIAAHHAEVLRQTSSPSLGGAGKMRSGRHESFPRDHSARP